MGVIVGKDAGHCGRRGVGSEKRNAKARTVVEGGRRRLPSWRAIAIHRRRRAMSGRRRRCPRAPSLVWVVETHGLTTSEATSDTEALAIRETDDEVSLVISQIHMPEMGGVTLLREALGRHPGMAIVVLAGLAEAAIAVHRLSRPPLDAVDELRRCAGTHFDAGVVKAFLRAFADPADLLISA
ncbi:MAG: hypothetical protein ACTHM9_07080 [Gemmatimonadales bacterium]